MHKLIPDNLLLINYSNMFRPLSRSHHQGVRNSWRLQSHCIDLLECCYVYVFTSRCDSCGTLKRSKIQNEQCSERSAYKIQTPGNYPEESTQHSEHGDILKSKIFGGCRPCPKSDGTPFSKRSPLKKLHPRTDQGGPEGKYRYNLSAG